MKTIHVKHDWTRFDGEDLGHSKKEFGHVTKDEEIKIRIITAYKVRWEEN